MATEIEVLAALQIVDQSLRAKTHEVGESEQRVAVLEDAVRAQKVAAGAAREELAGLSARQRDLEGRLAVAESKMKDRRMRISRIRNEKELGLARREVELLKEETSQLETELVEVMELVESTTAKVQEVETELARLTGELDTQAKELRDTLGRLSGEIERDRSARAELAEKLDEELRQRYEMVLTRRGGVAVVAIRNGTCQGCRMRVPPQLFNEIQRNQKVHVCPNCQRMLYWRGEAEEEANG